MANLQQMHATPPGDQKANQCKLRHLVDKFANLKVMQVGKIITFHSQSQKVHCSDCMSQWQNMLNIKFENIVCWEHCLNIFIEYVIQAHSDIFEYIATVDDGPEECRVAPPPLSPPACDHTSSDERQYTPILWLMPEKYDYLNQL